MACRIRYGGHNNWQWCKHGRESGVNGSILATFVNPHETPRPELQAYSEQVTVEALKVFTVDLR